MGYGYALLPTKSEVTSTMTFRLSPSEKRERDEWILGANNQGWSISEIAQDVGLSEQRVKQILNGGKKSEGRKAKNLLFDTPRDAALHEYMKNEVHPACKEDSMCSHCFGMMMIIESEYDADGWPHDWAMYAQERYIAMSKPRGVTVV